MILMTDCPRTELNQLAVIGDCYICVTEEILYLWQEKNGSITQSAELSAEIFRGEAAKIASDISK